ncbi:hypothetical protein OPT61_g8068 [Boeremia exigua]|uniref:Uncharacterized protein n=1 Tax=Boeremia exigua TaxID=749465 RepID=A0ACC2I0T4_9PLEO|nr:hypothetical protein OPT61_g8068 [Boeremia exigua]
MIVYGYPREIVDVLLAGVKKYYGSNSGLPRAMGDVLVISALDFHQDFIDTAVFDKLVKRYPRFAVSIVMAMKRGNQIDIRKGCPTCQVRNQRLFATSPTYSHSRNRFTLPTSSTAAMSQPNNRPAAKLFNNSSLSDVTIKQISVNGQVREYHAHKAILSAESSYFLKAFTGNFKEASDAVMEVHDDDPDHFEILLKCLYTYDYDKAAVDKLAAGSVNKRVLVPIGVHALADKYDVPCIQKVIADDLRSHLSPGTLKKLKCAIGAHYKTMMVAGGPVGALLASVLLEGQRGFMHTPEYQQLVMSNPTFGADMALGLARDTVDCRCSSCSKDFVLRRDVLGLERKWVHCPYCNCSAAVQE